MIQMLSLAELLEAIRQYRTEIEKEKLERRRLEQAWLKWLRKFMRK